MKRIAVLFIMCAVIFSIVAQDVRLVKEQRIYLWDVTLSMKGYKDRTPDIYIDVIDFISKDINAIKDETTIIKVAPFQEGILEVWTEPATVDGKKRIIERIKKYDNNKVTDTDILSALTRTERELVDKRMRNQIILLTDGKHNDPELHARFLKKINGGDWTKFARENNAFLRYVALIDMAIPSDFENTDTKILQVGFENVVFSDLTTVQEKRYNIKDNKDVDLYIKCSQDINLPELHFRVFCNDSIMTFEKDLILKDGKISFMLDYDYDVLKMSIPEEYTLPINITLLDAEKKVEQEILKPVLHTRSVNLILVNKPEKTLTIKIKR